MSKGYQSKMKELQSQLSTMMTNWEEDGSVPPNYVVKNGFGDRLAEVNRWCGGFQDPHRPKTIGWKAQHGNRSESGVVMVEKKCKCCGEPKESPITESIEVAKELAMDALYQLLGRKTHE